MPILDNVWCFLGTSQAISIFTFSGFALAIWQIYQSREDRKKSQKTALIQWRAEMYEQAFANITLSWEAIHERVQQFSFQFTNKPKIQSDRLSDYELRLIEVRFRLRGSKELHEIVSVWRDRATEIAHGCTLLDLSLTDNGGEWSDNDHKLLLRLKNELNLLDESFTAIESALKGELSFPKS